jgi:hypothetical protein
MRLLQFTTLIILVFFLSADLRAQDKQSVDYQQLTELFKEWRTFEKPPLREGAPDYTAVTFEKRWSEFLKLREKLNAIDHANWSTEKQVDWRIVWAEMNGYEFNYKTLKSWVRDPAFYKTIWTDRSDVPAHEGPTHHAVTELWTYKFPLSNAEMNRLIADLEVIQPLNEQAKINLTGNAKELWVAGIRDIRTQSEDLSSILTMSGVAQNTQLVTVINQAKKSTDDLVNWLEKEAKLKTGPSGIGKENYTWYQQNVHLVPLTWDEEVMLLKTELSRAWSLLKMEEHRNRNLPQLKAADSPEAYDELAKRSAESFIKFLDKRDIVTVKDYFAPALNEHLGRYIPKETRNFFYITMHYDPRPLYSHFYHWFELARMDNEPNVNPIRKGALLYNIFDSRNEGIATAVEELFMQAGLYDDSPRVREMVYILIAQRAARGLGSLYAHANELTMEEAGKIHSEYTPRGWMKTEKELLLFEQHLYLRQPGYGTSYITGKYLLENAMAEYAKKVEAAGEEFKVKDFFDRLNEIDNIPMTLGHWELTGDKGHLGRVFK